MTEKGKTEMLLNLNTLIERREYSQLEAQLREGSNGLTVEQIDSLFLRLCEKFAADQKYEECVRVSLV